MKKNFLKSLLALSIIGTFTITMPIGAFAKTPTLSETTSTVSGYPTVGYGYTTQGQYVNILQSWLKQLGYSVKADGVFGTKTKQALINFQKDNGLTADGICGQSTWEALEAEMCNMWG